MTTPASTDISPRAWAELLLISAIWGASFLSIRIALDEIPFVTSVAWRVGLAAIVLWGWILWRGLAPPARAAWGPLMAMGLLNNVIPFGLMAWGQLHIPTGLTSILNAGTAVFGVLAAALLADERLTPRRALGVGLGFAGVATAIGLDELRALNVTSLAQLAVVGGTVSYALAGVWAKRRLRGLAPEAAACGMLTCSALIAVPAALMIDGWHPPTQADTILAVGYYAVIATALAYLLYYRLLAMAGAGNLLLCTLLVAPVAILLGALVRDERLEAQAFAGFALLALGLSLLDGRLWRRLVPRPR
jgi:drug/metabolite transporter (DMT)-like permease